MGVLDHEKDIPSLDGWRALAISIVFLSHAGLGKLIPGGLGVTIFFFLSGFLITTLLLREFKKNDFINLRAFYIRRFLRITPPMLIVVSLAYLFVFFGFSAGGATIKGFVSQVFYFANYYGLYFDTGNTTPVGTGVFWSLAVEEHFYIFFPAVFIYFLRDNRLKYFGSFLLILCVFVLMWRMTLAGLFSASENRLYYASDTRIDSIVYGCFLAVCGQKKLPDWVLNRGVGVFSIIAGVVLILVSVLVRDAWFRETFRYSIQGVALLPLFFYSVARPDWLVFKILNNKYVKKIGVYSYTIYLVHYLLMENISVIFSNGLISAIVSLVFSLLIAWLMDRFVDKMLLPVRARFR